MSILAENLMTLRHWASVAHWNLEIQAEREYTLRVVAGALIGRGL